MGGGKQSAEDLPGWRAQCKVGLSETEASKLPLRIKEARAKTGLSIPGAFAVSPSDDGETEAIENALYALHMLEICLRLNTEDRALRAF